MIATPNNWRWDITPQQIEEIKAGNRETVNTVYMANMRFFKGMAVKYCHRVRQWSFLEDCIQQVYVDLPYYDFTDVKMLAYSIRKSFRRASMLSRYVSSSLDEPLHGIEDGKRTLGDTIAVDGFAQRERAEQERAALMAIAGQTQLTEWQRDLLTAYALCCTAYGGIYAKEFAACCID